MIPHWAKYLPWNLIMSNAEKSGVDPILVAAIVGSESKGKGWKCRFEKNYEWLFNPKRYVNELNSEDTEIILQKISWGPMQIMGAVAREAGYMSDLSELSKPSVGIKWGCDFLRRLCDAYGKSNMCDIVAIWNGGPGARIGNGTYKNQKYVDKVMGCYSELTKG